MTLYPDKTSAVIEDMELLINSEQSRCLPFDIASMHGRQKLGMRSRKFAAR